jgi:hypothetical protein
MRLCAGSKVRANEIIHLVPSRHAARSAQIDAEIVLGPSRVLNDYTLPILCMQIVVACHARYRASCLHVGYNNFVGAAPFANMIANCDATMRTHSPDARELCSIGIKQITRPLMP